MITSNRRLLRYASSSDQPLAGNAQHVFAWNHAISIFPSDSVFTFIPKCACSTFRFSIALANGAISDHRHITWIHANNATFKPSLAELAKARYTFVVLRDPFSRLLSCYLDKIVDKTPVAWQLHSKTGHVLDLDSLSFRMFVELVGKNLRLNEHWRPQVDFLVYENYDDYFYVEELKQASETLLRKIDLEVVDARALTRHGSDQYETAASNDSVCDMPAHRLSAMKQSGVRPQDRLFYDADLAATVGRLFADDVDLYRSKTARTCMV